MHTRKTVMQFRKSTKGTHVYSSDDAEASIKSLYVQRESMPSNPPEVITVTIEGGSQLDD